MSLITIRPSRQKFSSSKESEFFVAIKLTPPKLTLAERRPMSLSVALDNSSSMSQTTSIKFPEEARSLSPYNSMSRLDVAKFALAKLIEHMTAQDFLSLVSFNDRTQLVLPPTQMTADGKALARRRLFEVTARGSTALYAGLEEAIRLAKSGTGSLIRRAMLFTDGEANIGPQSLTGIEAALQGMFGTFGMPGISTFGIGDSYNGELLGALARDGGAHYYLDKPEQIPTAFGTELGTLASIYADGTSLTIYPQKGVEILEVLNNLPTHHMDANSKAGPLRINCGNLYSEQEFTVVLKVKATRRRASKTPLGILSAEAEVTLAKGGFLKTDIEHTAIRIVASDEADATDDAEVMSAVAVQLTAKAQREAMADAARGDYLGAQKRLRRTADIAKSYGRHDLGLIAEDTSRRGYNSRSAYLDVGSKISASLGKTFDRQTAGMGGQVVGGVNVDSLVSNSIQKNMAAAFSITKSNSSDDDMPDVNSMVTR